MAITKELILKALEDLKAEAKEAVEKLKSSRGIAEIAKAAFGIIPHVLELVEKVGKDFGIKGSDKKSLAVEILNALIPRPWFLSWVPEATRIAVLGAAVDGSVAIFNRFWKKKPAA